jgi:hypothetical protein
MPPADHSPAQRQPDRRHLALHLRSPRRKRCSEIPHELVARSPCPGPGRCRICQLLLSLSLNLRGSATTFIPRPRDHSPAGLASDLQMPEVLHCLHRTRRARAESYSLLFDLAARGAAVTQRKTVYFLIKRVSLPRLTRVLHYIYIFSKQPLHCAGRRTSLKNNPRWIIV